MLPDSPKLRPLPLPADAERASLNASMASVPFSLD